jgi:diguanylate cyclase (GGDEF)-like protein
LRQEDILARMGGDEFMVFLPAKDLYEAAAIAERIRVAIQNLSIETSQLSFHVTVSVGVAPLTEDIVDFEALLMRADEALYNAKRAGRAQVHVWSLDIPPGTILPVV